MTRRSILLALLLCAVGAASAAAQTTLIELQGTAANERFGWSQCALGDVDGDGTPDFAVGAPGAAGGAGVVRVFSGATFRIVYSAFGGAGEAFGTCVAALDDRDGDGVADFVASAPDAKGGGYVRTVSGATGATIAVRSAPAARRADGAHAAFGAALKTGGDFDRDGVADWAASSTVPGARIGIYSGATGALLADATPPALGGEPSASFSFARDLNGDGYDDFVVGAHRHCPVPHCSLSPNGAAFLGGGPAGAPLGAIVGAPAAAVGRNVADAGDLNGDGRPEIVVANAPQSLWAFPAGVTVHDGATGAVLWRLGSGARGGYPGLQGATIARLGDVDGDGIGDLAFGSGGDAWWEGATGATVVSGATGTPLASWTGPTSTVNWRVAAAGDLNGDGAAELLVGRPHASVPCVDCGSVLVLSVPLLPAATAATLAGGCGALAGGPVLTATPPVLGGSTTFALEHGTPFAVGNLALDFGADVATPFGPCTLHLDPARLSSWLLLPIGVDASGDVVFALPVAAAPALAGLPVTAQAFLLGTLGPLGFDLSNGVRTTLGF